MATDLGYVLGIDGLRRGTHAAIARNDVVATFVVGADDKGSLGDLEARVRQGFDLATRLMAEPPHEVRVVCIDDGGDGDAIARGRAWLDGMGVELRVLDLLSGEQSEPAWTSESRARGAALWWPG